MTYYLDTSALVAWFHPGNPHCRPLLAWREKHSVELAYNRMLQLEAGHYLRKLSDAYAAIAWNAFRAVETMRLYQWHAVAFSSVFERAEQISQRHKAKIQCGFWDLCHVVAALREELPLVTADRKQKDAAELLGLKVTLIG